MKKIKFISAIALTMVMASCDDFDLPNPPGQTNPEPEAVFENSGIVLTQGDATVNLVEANKANTDVTVANITELVNFPADYTLSVDMDIAGDASFSNATTISTTIVDNAVMVNPDIFNGAIQKSITKKPGVYEVYSRFKAYAERGTTRVRLGGLDAFFAADSKFNVTTLDPVKVMEEAYYLVPCDANGNPVMSKAVKMNNTLGNVSVYDNPEFALKVTVDAAAAESETGYLWKVAPQSAVTAGSTDGVMGCNPSVESTLAGKLGAGYDAGSIKAQGDFLITINVELDSYSINYAFEVLYPFTSGNTSKPDDVMLLYTDNYINYTGVAMLNTIWYCAGQPDYRGAVVFKQDQNVGFEDSEDGLTRTGGLTASADGARLDTPVKGKHLYWLDVNLVQLTYSITCLNTLSVIGSGNGWDLATATELTPSADFKVWTAKNVAIGDEFKINANGAWAIGFSGTSVPDATGKQVFVINKQDGGDNLKATPGTYDVTVDFSTKPYTVVLE